MGGTPIIVIRRSIRLGQSLLGSPFTLPLNSRRCSDWLNGVQADS